MFASSNQPEKLTMPLLRRTFQAFAVCLLCVTPLLSDAHSAEPDSIDRDYAAELPRIKPVEAKDALSTFTIAEGFRVEQVAAEPNVVDPIAMAFDENGRLFVVEMR